VVLEVWESQAAAEGLFASRSAPALQSANVPEPTAVQWFAQIGGAHRH
jgi:hypothetical protein